MTMQRLEVVATVLGAVLGLEFFELLEFQICFFVVVAKGVLLKGFLVGHWLLSHPLFKSWIVSRASLKA